MNSSSQVLQKQTNFNKVLYQLTNDFESLSAGWQDSLLYYFEWDSYQWNKFLQEVSNRTKYLCSIRLRNQRINHVRN